VDGSEYLWVMSRISESTVAKIFDAARIEDVVGDFVQLKRSGSNLKGLSPFTNEKTPSFFVSPAKQIFKCFSSGKGGSAVSFLMELEAMTYPEALRWLAKRYQIEIEEQELDPGQQEAAHLRERLYLIQDLAAKYYTDQLWHTEKGRAVGLSYFTERGFDSETIRLFQLGFSPDERAPFTEHALEKGHSLSLVEKAGLVRVNERGNTDLFRGRVIFPIHGLTGRILGFGGRILRKDVKAPKYVNSPETEIYHKSRVLYGLYQSKKAIIQAQKCLMVEGYTDVLSMHQAGIQNVVATSGTALTPEQISLVQRLTENITFLFDGDPAGIRASLRGIDMVLKQGMNVRVALLPDGDDPDSFAKKKGREGLNEFLKNHEQDFIRFRCDLLKEEAQDDPIVKSRLVQDLVGSIALIPQAITRDMYIRLAARETDTREELLQQELASALQRHSREEERARKRESASQQREGKTQTEPLEATETSAQDTAEDGQYFIEREILRLMLNHGHKEIEVEVEPEEGEAAAEDAPKMTEKVSLVQHMLEELYNEDHPLTFHHPVYARVLTGIREAWEAGKEIKTIEDLLHREEGVEGVVADLLFERHKMSNWQRKEVYVTNFDSMLGQAAEDCLLRLWKRDLHDQEELNAAELSGEDSLQALKRQKYLNQQRKEIAKKLYQVV
jgi:DNA primase